MSNVGGKNYKRGSEWQKWDLHVHTPASYAWDDPRGDETYKKIIKRMNESDVAAFAITDYWTFDGFKKLMEIDGGLSGDDKLKKTVFPGIELRFDILTDDQDKKRVNFQAIFNIDDGLDKALYRINQFYKHLKLSSTEKIIDEQSFIDIAKDYPEDVLQELTGKKQSACEKEDYLMAGYKSCYVSYDCLIGVLNKSKDLRDNLFISAPWDKYGGISRIDPLLRDDIKKKLTKLADILETGKEETIKLFLLDKDLLKNKSWSTSWRQFLDKKIKPCICGSDAKKVNDIGLYPENKACWIKSESTFEGLKQITYEPKLRVKIQKNNPRESQTYARIDRYSINFPGNLKIQDSESDEESDFCIKGKDEIYFSDNLTCIIGGRGSGKSSLIHLLYNALEGRDSERLRKISSPLIDLKLSPDPLSKINELVDVDVPLSTEFFLQNEIEKFAKDISQMSELIRHRLNRLSSINTEDGSPKATKELKSLKEKQSLHQLGEKWNGSSSRIDELIDAHDNITSLDQKISGIKRRIKTLKTQTEVIKSEKYKTLREEVKSIALEISNFKNYESEYTQVVKELSSVVKSASKLDWNEYKSQSVLDELIRNIGDYKTKLRGVFKKAERVYKEKKCENSLRMKKEELKSYLKEKKLSPENIEELTDATEQINKLDNQIRVFESQKEIHKDVYKRKNNILEEYKSDHGGYRDRFFKVAGKLQKSLKGLKFSKNKHEITFHPRINESILENKVVDFIKSNNTSKTLLSSDNIKSVIFGNSDTSAFVGNKEKIVEAVNTCDKATIHTKVLKELLNDSGFTEGLHLRIVKYFFDINNIQIQTKLGDKPLQNTSFGERCGIVMGIVLVAGTNPIVIDQPEDNLDGKFISNVLVPLLRKQKRNRQIILITRDANIVIGGDSELIEILEEDDDRTILIPSTIENKSNRSRYIWILDGGEQAFQQREKKYGLLVK